MPPFSPPSSSGRRRHSFNSISSLLRTVVAKFLPILCRVPRGRAIVIQHFGTRGPKIDLRLIGACSSHSSECRSSSHTSDRPFLHGTGRLRGFYAHLSDHHRSARTRLFPGRTLDHSPVAIPGWNAARLTRRSWRFLVPGTMGNWRCTAPRFGHCFHRDVLLGPLQRARQTSIRATRLGPQFWHHQLSDFRASASAHIVVRKNRHPVARRAACQHRADHLRGSLHHALRTFSITSPFAKSA